MTIRNLDALFKPQSVVLVGASARPSSVGRILARNLQRGGFRGRIHCVHPEAREIEGLKTCRSLKLLPEAPDLAVIATPPATVPERVAELGALGTRAAVVVSAGFAEERGEAGRRLQQQLLDAARPHLLRIVGPNCLGILLPRLGLNASFSHLDALPGGLALVAQSGAIVSSIVDWARPQGIGFSHLVALGNMADVDFGDMLDYLAQDPETRAILLYTEAVTQARKFMSAARAAARLKPVIALKAGRFPESARAVASHTGAMATQDDVYDAAMRRAGIVRVTHLDDLFEAAAILSTGVIPPDASMTIVTNGGGMGVLASDTLLAHGGQLATPAEETLKALDALLPPAWSRANPVDIIGDADGDRYARTLEVLLARPETGALLVLNCPTGIASGMESAQAVAEVLKKGGRRTVLSSWVGEETAEPARQLLARSGIPSYPTPTRAVRAFMHLVRYRRGQETLMETPPSLPEKFSPDKARARQVIESALRGSRPWLSETESKALLAAYDIPVYRGGSGPSRTGTFDLVAGAFTDPVFGPLILFGHGGTATELLNDKALALPPLNLHLAQELMSRTRIWRLLRGFRDHPPANIEAIALTLIKLAQLVADHAEVQELDLNPVLADDRGVIVLDARCRVIQAAVPDRLAIRPYPKELEQDIVLGDGRKLWLRPIMPEDEPALRASFARLTPEEIRLRFFVRLKSLSHQMAARLTQIDYDREMALILTEHKRPGGADVFGSVRIVADPDRERAEFAILVRHDMSGLGLGAVLMRRIIDYARARGIGEIFGDVLAHNAEMLALGKALGFREIVSPDDPELRRLTLSLRTD